ncbi:MULTISPECIES: WXG100 family type VII secretion target [Streptomyces]|uniref:Enoyl-CoA hydratase/isomerase family protein n=1 Tax=Streptomyces koelreuteriae TaxID=2838015 RepID=A0ABX8FRI8_9ACTN|nr:MULTISPECIES: WXG100 family type VII secretion target [Streptomyces]QWB23803.1 enoyl-CoA hydratase/isomerase family protein [Streptomyces koelreuteriae]UUA06782.1 WXG100 family type VII secretion target [Streptomyces koelreuteriae]UUA14411.1 WXG100 family type VII secretion target [Streptomyces sp. CRCS-T-1]
MAGQRTVPPNIGWDPTPGSVEDTRELAKRLGKLAGELGTAVRELERIECGAWKGKTAVAFTEYIGEDVTPLIRKSHESFDKASRALHRWANDLQDFQDETDRLEKKAGEKLDAKAEAKEGTDEYGKASGDVTGLIQKVHELEDRYKQAAAKISKELDKAADIAPDEPGFWEKLGNGIADAWDATGDWLKEHADLIKAIGDVMGDITAVLGMLAIVTLPFPPLAAIFGTAALIGAGLTLATHGVAKAAGADVSWATLGLDAVGLLPGIGMFGKGVKVVGAGKAALTAERLGKGFSATKIGSSRVLMSFGKESADISGGLGKAGLVKIGGMSNNVFEVAHGSSGLMSRMGGLSYAGYHQGQLIGSKGANMIPGVAINPFSAGGIALDAGLKVAPKIYGHIAGD